MDLLRTIEVCGLWRRLIDANRELAGALGFAFWKQDTIAPLLWSGGAPLPFWRSLPTVVPSGSVAVWRSKVRDEDLAQLEQLGTPLVEVEDGFLRSSGLGADCVPPMSVTVDRLGAYFDPATASELEQLLQQHSFDADLLARARKLREAVVTAGIGKYESGRLTLSRPGGSKRHILVPGQVEDDRSVMTGGGGMSNLELLQRVRALNPEAYLIYKPHPDVEAGHRVGAIPREAARALADEIMTDVPIAALLELADEVHVNTSQAGFEALMRGTPVMTYGVPFYAGWGLTHDFGPVPARRTARRSLDELVAATLLLYPRYLDPLTGLPCPAETVVERLVKSAPKVGLLVRLRRLQGRLRRISRESVFR
jgi:capsular polysaccharide export protein